jgi:uncharacterized membrane protein YjgN (DUF898 family)
MLVFQGELVDGFELEKAKESLKALFKVSQEKIEQLFSLPAVVVKKDLSHELAQQFQQRLQRLGVVTVIRPMVGTHLVQATEQPAPRSEAEPAAQTPAAVQEAAITGLKAMPFRFEGRGGEYFKIWIVNVLLSVLTLGIYSAWAKVRNHRYFYSNTYIGNHSFEYLADPVTILKGRIVAAIFLAGYVLSGEFFPALGLVFMLIFLVALPWLVCKSMAFRNRNTAYRNIRFGFDGTYKEALIAFVLLPIAAVLTLMILAPYAFYRQKRFIVENSRYGTTPFEPNFVARDFYGIFLRALGLLILAILLAVVPFIGPLLTLVVYLLVFAYVSANTTNLIFNNSWLQKHGFESRLAVGKLAWIYVSNWLLVALTIGLAMPWAKVRLANYHADCLTLRADGSIDGFVAAEEKHVSSLGEEIGDAFDMDIGL